MNSTPELTPEGTPRPVVSVPVLPSTDDGTVAVNYVAREVLQARRTLRRTQIGSGILLGALALYLGAMTYHVKRISEPQAAAEIATGMIAERVSLHGEDMAQQFKARIPVMIQSLPDEAKRRLPEAREALLSQIETDLGNYSRENSQRLGKEMDNFLDLHKEELRTVIEVGSDRQALRAIGPDLERELTGYLQAPPEGGGESVQAKINKSLAALKEIKARTHRLANAKDLTLEERKTRRAIAIVSKTVNQELKGVDISKAIADHVTLPE